MVLCASVSPSVNVGARLDDLSLGFLPVSGSEIPLLECLLGEMLINVSHQPSGKKEPRFAAYANF